VSVIGYFVLLARMIKIRMIGSAYGTQRNEEKGIQDFGGKASRKGGLGRPKSRHYESNKMDLK